MRACMVCVVCATACGFQVPNEQPGDAMRPDVSDGMPDARVCGAIDVSAGGDHTCARMTDGTLYCWGRGASGELGVAPISTRCTPLGVSTICSPLPLRVAIPPVTSYGLGSYHTCAATTGGTYCWGQNGYGGFGDATTTSATTPVKITQRDGAGTIDAGRYHTCSVGVDGLSCSGGNLAGEVGNNMTVPETTSTVVMTGVTTFVLGDYLSCAIDNQQQVSCWGRNAYREIDATGINKLVPTQIAGLANVAHLAAGVDHICAVFADHSAQCWGSNTRGQLGNNMTSTAPQAPVAVAVPDLVDVAADRDHTCVRDATGNIWCFGEGYGVAPVQIAMPHPATTISTGNLHDCAVADDHTVWCWGNQDNGQLGNGVSSATRQLTPQQAQLCP